MRHHFPPRLSWLRALAFLAVGSLWTTRAFPAPEIDVILWFDTEDYLLPADDDAAKRLAEMLTARHIRATFKVVGEKARTLERRRRTDVIAALRRHDIGYHANFHSVHPTPTEYLADCGWLDGIAEFSRREGRGAGDVRRIFGVTTLACYGQPGSSWAPQAVAALREIGVAPLGTPCYVDEGTHVGFDDKPFWYAGALNVYHMGANYTRMELHDPDAVEPAKARVAEIAGRLRAEGGGLISIFYHPCEWVHQEFWDGVNFSHGANPPREQWRPPRQRAPAETEAAFARFGAYIDFINRLPGIRWVTASQLPALYKDGARADGVTDEELTELARRVALNPGGADVQWVRGAAYSVADQFELLVRAVAEGIGNRPVRWPLRARGLLGPDAEPPAPWSEPRLDWPAFRDAAVDAADFVRMEGRVPARVFVGPDPASPADFLVALAGVWVGFHETKQWPTNAGVTLGRNVRVLPESHVAADTPRLFGDWVIHRSGFRASHLMQLARLQAWTLKPAVRSPDRATGANPGL